ncbi:glycoside hydrolase family 32 protein [Nocardiopsis salina]|uniref:glycoside hydrolase family 32 protein n=1 Tax=Nocardiopsis salina TaxID=245836 RepID=UPI0003453299|nr:glycoside hydrolase family 32 protein [Nocardiopsis salina]
MNTPDQPHRIGRRLFIGGTGAAVGAGLFAAGFAPAGRPAAADPTPRWRPLVHFTPERNWMNDPNGLVHLDGEFHQFFQYNPGGKDHADMHWGHSVSTDLVHWEERPVALEPDELGEVYSGGAVVDHDDDSGFFDGGPGLIAFYTSAGDEQVQSLAHSDDSGRSWTMYEGNPVIGNPGIEDFRDPKVVWHADSGAWVLMLAADDRILFYRSSDLREWEEVSGFGPGHGAHGGVWECPELFELPVDGDDRNTRWVLVVSINPGGPAGGSAVQYFVGDFDGWGFTPHDPPEQTLWADGGSDFYAVQSWSDVPEEDGRRMWTGWMSNWDYAEDVPTDPWRGAMSLPREVGLTETADGIRLTQMPVAEIEGARTGHEHWEGELVEDGEGPAFTGTSLDVELEADPGSASVVGLEVLTGQDCRTLVGVDLDAGELFVDRTEHGSVEVTEGFRARHTMRLEDGDGPVRLRVVVDRSTVEVFGGRGQAVITDLVLPDADADALRPYAEGGTAHVTSLDVHGLG